MKYQFAVQGSSRDPYNIHIEYSENKFTATCSCQLDAIKGPYLCKHLTPILTGKVPIGFTSGDKNAIPTVSKAFYNSEVGKQYLHFIELEKLVKEKDKEMKDTKKLVAKILYQM